MSSSPVNKGLTGLFSDLAKCEQSYDWEKAVKIANKILSIEKEDLKAFHCKIVSKIKLDSCEEALDDLENNPRLSEKLLFEKAYCLYRVNKFEECLDVLDEVKDFGESEKELKCQALYRLERYQESYDLFLDVIKNSNDEYEFDRESDLAAVLAGLSLTGQKFDESCDLGDDTFELVFNKACIDIGQNEYQKALEKLNTAEELCRKTLDEEKGYTDEEIENELAPIRSQLGYLYQKLDKENIAIKLYSQVLKQKPTDQALLAVVCNNVVTINRDQNLFDSKKKIKAAVNEAQSSEMGSIQRRAILYNSCILLLQTNQNAVCRQHLQKFKEAFPDLEDQAIVLETALLLREKKGKKATELIENYLKEKDSIELRLIITQIYVTEGKIGEATTHLKKLVTSGLAIVSVLVALYISQNNLKGAVETIKSTIKLYQVNKVSNPDVYVLYREAAKHLMKANDHKAAAQLLEELRKIEPNNLKLMIQLIAAYSAFDPSKAKQISDKLPSLEHEWADVDVEALENGTWSLGTKYVKKTAKIEPSPIVNAADKKKKKKRKKILPKNYDPNVQPNPERWLPKWQRSTFKKRRDRRNPGASMKGTQGSVATAENEPKSSPKPTPQMAGSRGRHERHAGGRKTKGRRR